MNAFLNSSESKLPPPLLATSHFLTPHPNRSRSRSRTCFMESYPCHRNINGPTPKTLLLLIRIQPMQRPQIRTVICMGEMEARNVPLPQMLEESWRLHLGLHRQSPCNVFNSAYKINILLNRKWFHISDQDRLIRSHSKIQNYFHHFYNSRVVAVQIQDFPHVDCFRLYDWSSFAGDWPDVWTYDGLNEPSRDIY